MAQFERHRDQQQSAQRKSDARGEIVGATELEERGREQMNPACISWVVSAGSVCARTCEIQCVQRMAGFDRIERARTQGDKPGERSINGDCNPSEIFHRDYVDRAFKPLVAEIARKCCGSLGRIAVKPVNLAHVLVEITEFTTQAPFTPIVLLRASHDGIAICPDRLCQPARDRDTALTGSPAERDAG